MATYNKMILAVVFNDWMSDGCVFLKIEKGFAVKNKNIVVAGHVALDMTPSFPKASSTALTLNDFIKPGKLVNVGALTIKPGGCVTNTGGALHFFGADVTLLCKIGGDVFGRILQDDYRAHGYKADFIVASSETTSYTVIIAPPGCDRFFLHDSAVNDTFSPDEIDYDFVRRAGLFHFGYPSLMKRFYEDGGESLSAMYRKIKEAGVVTSMDTAAIDPDGPAAECDWRGVLSKTLPYVDFFMPSIEELAFMLDRPYYDELQKRADGDDICRHLSLKGDVEPMAKKTLEMGCKAVLLKCGAPGMYLAVKEYPEMKSVFAEETAREWGGFSSFSKSFIPDRILSGTGAGDTSIAAFLYGIVNGMPPRECLDLASGTGTCCLTGYDALSGLLSIEELKKKIAAGWEREELIHP